jgi:hypothetical protein
MKLFYRGGVAPSPAQPYLRNPRNRTLFFLLSGSKFRVFVEKIRSKKAEKSKKLKKR